MRKVFASGKALLFSQIPFSFHIPLKELIQEIGQTNEVAVKSHVNILALHFSFFWLPTVPSDLLAIFI